MTTGFPDYGRYAPVSGNELVNTTVTSAGFTSAIIPAGFYSNIALSANNIPSGTIFNVTVFWYADANGATLVSQSQHSMAQLLQHNWMVPVIAPYVQFVIQLKSGTTVFSFKFLAYGTTSPYSALMAQQFGTPLLDFDGSVAAGANVTLGPAPIAVGPCVWSVSHANNNAWNAELQYLAPQTGVFLRYVRWEGANYGTNHSDIVSVPGTSFQVVLINSDTVARTMTCSVTLGG